MTMTLELRFENSCSSHHDFVIDARLGEGSQFMDRLVAGLDRMDHGPIRFRSLISGTSLLYP
jgi:hypothetical protein